jgi:hypothetical protein
MTDGDLVLEELRRISKILTLAHGESLEKELSKIATSDERKRIWVLIDSVKLPKDIAKEVGVSVRSVNRFLAIGEKAGLIENPWGKPPKRLIDYVPASWIELTKLPEEKGEIKVEGSPIPSSEIETKKAGEENA